MMYVVKTLRFGGHVLLQLKPLYLVYLIHSDLESRNHTQIFYSVSLSGLHIK